MLTSSTPGIGWTLSFFNAVCNFLSSCAVEGFALRTILRRTEPFPPVQDVRQLNSPMQRPPNYAPIRLLAACAWSFASFAGSIFLDIRGLTD